MDRIGVFTQKQFLNNGLQKFESRVAPYLIDNGVEPIYREEGGDYPFSKTVQNVKNSRKLRRKSKDFDRIFLPAQSMLTANPEKLECQVVPYVHDILPYTSFLSSSRLSATNYAVKAIQQLLGQEYIENLVKADKIIAASELTKKDLEQRTNFDGEIEVVYQGIDGMPEKDVNLSQERDIDLLYVGTLRERKNPRFIKETFRKAHEKGLKVVSVNYQEIDLPGETLTNISDEELAEVYNRTKFYLHPTYLEGFGRGPVEAQRYGAVPLALDNDINHEVLGEEGVSWLSVDTPTTSLEYIMQENPDSYQDKAIKNSKRFKWSETQKEILNLLEK